MEIKGRQLPRFSYCKMLAPLAIAVAIGWAFPTNAGAQQPYPARPIRIVVPLLPGAAADVLPRLVAEKLSAQFGQPVMVENRPGANGNIGAELVASAEADGYTLLATPSSPLITNESFYEKLGFNPRSFVPVSVIATMPNVLVTKPTATYASISEFLTYAKSNPDKLSYGSPGVGSAPYLAMEWLKHLSKISMTHVPYNGIPPVIRDVTAGHLEMTFANAFTVHGLIREGKLRALGVDSHRRIPELPDVPAITEIFSGYVVTTWFAIVAPPNTPPAVALTLSAAISRALKEPDVANKLRDLSATPGGGTPAETAAFINQERERWTRVIAAAGLRKQ